MTEFRIDRENVSFWLRVKPRANRERLAMDSSGDLRLELHAPAAEGRANEACIRFFACGLQVPQAYVVIISGEKSRRKLLRVTGMSPEESIARIKALATNSGGGKKI
jgi:uncharacterized protein